MKKTILIVAAILITLLIVGVWIYIFMYGTPKNADEVFTRFSLGGDAENFVLPPPTTTALTEGEETVIVRPPLRQLTTRAVAGAVFRDSYVRFVEQGTGHIYDIGLITQTEKIVSGTTIPKAAEAVFGDHGTMVAISTYTPEGRVSIWGMIDETDGGSIDRHDVPLGAYNIAFDTNASRTLLYTLRDEDGLMGYAQPFGVQTAQKKFKIPLLDVTVLWGNPTYIHTTPTYLQTGYLYTLKNGVLTYTTKPDFGLTAFRTRDLIIPTILKNGEPSSYRLGSAGETTVQMFPMLPEKCAAYGSSTTSVICAIPFEPAAGTYPDLWYKGVAAYSDLLWIIDTEALASRFVSDFLEESGRDIDVSSIVSNDTGSAVIFINKNDNSLWIHDGLTPDTPALETVETETETSSTTTTSTVE